MNLIQTVSIILEKQVTEQEAKDFALEQYGVLASFIRNQVLDKNIQNRNKPKKNTDIILFGSSSKKYLNNKS
jgi:hypothetical protein